MTRTGGLVASAQLAETRWCRCFMLVTPFKKERKKEQLVRGEANRRHPTFSLRGLYCTVMFYT